MTNVEIDVLIKRYKDQFDNLYQRGRLALNDGFDFKDIAVFNDVAKETVAVLESLNRGLLLQDKKDVVYFLILKLYDEYSKKLPWYVRMIPFKDHFVKKNLKKYIEQAFDYLKEKGMVQG